jgi:hypothetical protein
MGFKIESLFSHLHGIDDSISKKELKEIRESTEVEWVQTSTPLKKSTWTRLNEELFKYRPDINLRLYGFFRKICDLQILKLLPHVQRFSIDNLHGNVLHLEAITELPKLTHFRIGIFELDNLDILQRLPDSLVELGVFQTRSKRPDIEAISRFTKLRTLSIEGHSKGLDSIRHLPLLEDLTLRSVKSKDLSYLANLGHLWSVDIKLGGITNLAGLEQVPNLKYLELWMIRAFEDLSVLSGLHSLQNLFLESLSRVTHLPDLAALQKLRRVYIQNLKSLEDFSSLQFAPALEEFRLTDGKAFQRELLAPVLKNPNLKRASASFGSNKQNDKFSDLRDSAGLQPTENNPFIYD